MAKDSLFLSQPSRDWAPGGKLAEQARRKHNQRAAFLRNSANSAGIPLNVNTDSNEANANTVTSNDGQMDGSADGTGSGSGLEEKIRDAMKLHFNQNGMASNSTRKGSSDLEHEKSSVKLEGLAGKSEDRILTSGQVSREYRAFVSPSYRNDVGWEGISGTARRTSLEEAK